MTRMATCGLASIFILVSLAACSPSTQRQPSTDRPTASRTIPTTASVRAPITSEGPPLPLKDQNPCDLLDYQQKEDMGAFDVQEGKSYEGRQCTFGQKIQNMAPAAVTVVTIVTDGSVSDSGAIGDVKPLTALQPVGRHQGAETDHLSGQSRYSIVVTSRSRVDVTVSSTMYPGYVSGMAVGTAREIEPRLP